MDERGAPGTAAGVGASTPDLGPSREELLSRIERLESRNEELTSSNTEYQAANATLQTVNVELTRRIGELDRSKDDLTTLLESTRIATIVLDRGFAAVTRAETALRGSEERYRSMVAQATAGIAQVDLAGAFTVLNDRFCEIVERERDALVGRPMREITHPDDRALDDGPFRAMLATGESYTLEKRYVRPDGEPRWVRVHVSGLLDDLGGIVGGRVVCIDVHVEHEALQGLKTSESRAKLLLAELQHRVRNTLAIVRSIATRTVEASRSLGDFEEHFNGRIGALARAQTILTRNADIDVDLSELVSEEIIAQSSRDAEQVTIGGPPVRLKAKAAEALALAFHELATNSVKYGALASPAGRVDVSWRALVRDGGARLNLTWRESGVGGLDGTPLRRGFGRELIEQQLPYEIDAITSIDFQPQGVLCRVDIPLVEKVAMLDERALPAEDPAG